MLLQHKTRPPLPSTHDECVQYTYLNAKTLLLCVLVPTYTPTIVAHCMAWIGTPTLGLCAPGSLCGVGTWCVACTSRSLPLQRLGWQDQSGCHSNTHPAQPHAAAPQQPIHNMLIPCQDTIGMLCTAAARLQGTKQHTRTHACKAACCSAHTSIPAAPSTCFRAWTMCTGVWYHQQGVGKALRCVCSRPALV